MNLMSPGATCVGEALAYRIAEQLNTRFPSKDCQTIRPLEDITGNRGRRFHASSMTGPRSPVILVD